MYHTDGVRAPDGTEIITKAMIDKHVIERQDRWQVLQLLCAAADLLQGERLDIDRERIGECRLLVSPKDSSGMNRAMSAYREAERALSYINSRVETVSAKDKLLANMKWRYSQAEV